MSSPAQPMGDQRVSGELLLNLDEQLAKGAVQTVAVSHVPSRVSSEPIGKYETPNSQSKGGNLLTPSR